MYKMRKGEEDSITSSVQRPNVSMTDLMYADTETLRFRFYKSI